MHSGGARVIQIGGGSRDLYYYPKDTVLVTAILPKLNKGKDVGKALLSSSILQITDSAFVSQPRGQYHEGKRRTCVCCSSCSVQKTFSTLLTKCVNSKKFHVTLNRTSSHLVWNIQVVKHSTLYTASQMEN